MSHRGSFCRKSNLPLDAEGPSQTRSPCVTCHMFKLKPDINWLQKCSTFFKQHFALFGHFYNSLDTSFVRYFAHVAAYLHLLCNCTIDVLCVRDWVCPNSLNVHVCKY